MTEPSTPTDWSVLEPDSDPSRPQPVPWELYADDILQRWRKLLDTDPEESEVQEFLELHPSMIPGGSGDVGPGGHHRSEMRAVYRRPTLQGAGRSFEPDFMWVTRSSALITPILIEIEKPSKRWFRRGAGRPTSDFVEAHDQLNDWRTWFKRDQNMSVFRSQFVHDDQFQLPIEPQFVLIYGRDREFSPGDGHDDPDSLRRKRDGMRTTDESFISFDSLAPRYDHRDSLTVTMTAKGPQIWAVSSH